MKFSSDVSLTRRSAIAVVSCLWNQPNIIADVENFLLSYNYTSDYWNSIEFKVLSSLKKLEIPKELKLMLENLLQPMGKQIYKWVSHTRFSCQAYPRFSKQIMFTHTEHGTLDYIKTSRLIIDCCSENMLRFHIACIFCLEDVILKLWPDVKHTLLERINTYPFFINVTSVMYWVHYLNGTVKEMMTLYEYCGEKNNFAFAFYLKLDDRCITSINYFLLQMEPDKRQRLILKALQKMLSCARPHDGNILISLFSHLKEKDIDQIINEKTYAVLASLLDWPCTEYFMAVANSSWNNLSNSNYMNIFIDIIESVADYCIGDIYKILAKQFWKFAPLAFKRYVIQKCISGTFLSRLFQYENADDIVQIVLNDCSPDERQQIIFYFESFNICDFLVRKERWKSLKLFVKSCISSPAVLDEFMMLYTTYEFWDKEGSALRTTIFFKNIGEWYNIVDFDLHGTH